MDKPDIKLLSVMIFAMTLCFVQIDVCIEAMIVERSKLYESLRKRGEMQSISYIVRFFGSIFGALLGAILYNQDEWGWGVPIWGIFLLNGFVPFLIAVPFLYHLVEAELLEPTSIKEQVLAIWSLVQRKAVWMPGAFLYIYNLLLIQNPAWNSFLVDSLGFSDFELGLLVLVGTILSYLALVTYKQYLFHTSWRSVYIFTTLTMVFFTCMQLVLVLGWNKSISMGREELAMIFAVLSNGGAQFAISIQLLPVCRMFLNLCPTKYEGTSYAMLTTISNVAQTVSYSIAAAVATIWDVSNDTLEDHDYSGMWKLTLFCGCIQVVGLLFIGLMPSGIEEQVTVIMQFHYPLYVTNNMAYFHCITVYIVIICYE